MSNREQSCAIDGCSDHAEAGYVVCAYHVSEDTPAPKKYTLAEAFVKAAEMLEAEREHSFALPLPMWIPDFLRTHKEGT